MPPLQDVLIALRTTWSEWTRTSWTDLEFGDARTALLVFVVLLAIALLFLLVSFMRSGSLRGKIGLPAVLPVMRRSPLSLVRHVPLMLIPGLSYVLYVELRGLLAGEYPYTILDPGFAPPGGAAAGPVGVAVSVGVLVVLVAIFDLLLVFVDGLIARRGLTRAAV